MLQWRIYYGDGSTFSSEDGEPQNAPCRNVICIVEANDDLGRYIVHRRDYYWWSEAWYGGDIFGLFDYLSDAGYKVVKFGRTLPNAAYRAIYHEAVHDPDFPRKSAWNSEEKL
jgi:hypothetical protein